jgi:hypothetical protein
VEPSEGALALNWSESKEQRFSLDALKASAEEKSVYLPVPSPASNAKNYKSWSKDLAAWIVTHQKFYLLHSPSTGEYSQPNEAERSFRIRLNETATEQRDKLVEQLRGKYQPKVNALQDKVMHAEQQLEREREEANAAGIEAAVSIGATVLGAFTGKRSLGRSATSAAKEASRAAMQKQEIARSEQTVASLHDQFQQLQDEFANEVASVRSKYEASSESFETASFAPKKTNIQVRLVTLVWAPYIQQSNTLVPAWQTTV